MTYPNSSTRDPRNGRRDGMGGTWIAIAVVAAIIMIGGYYLMRENGTASTASNTPSSSTATTTGSSSPASTAPASTPTPAPATNK